MEPPKDFNGWSLTCLIALRGTSPERFPFSDVSFSRSDSTITEVSPRGSSQLLSSVKKPNQRRELWLKRKARPIKGKQQKQHSWTSRTLSDAPKQILLFQKYVDVGRFLSGPSVSHSQCKSQKGQEEKLGVQQPGTYPELENTLLSAAVGKKISWPNQK